MYKGASESQSYLKRVASHSTKPSRSGVVSVLPPDATPDLELYEDLKARHAEAAEASKKIAEQLVDLKRRRIAFHQISREYSLAKERGIRYVPKPKELLALDKERDELGGRATLLQRDIAALRTAMNAAYSKAYEKVFVALAKLILSQEAFDAIDARTFDAIGHPPNKFYRDRERVELKQA